MTREELTYVLENLQEDREVMLDSSAFAFGLLLTDVQDTMAIIFGGYGNHQSIFDPEVMGYDQIVDEIIEHISGYNSEIEGKEWCDLEELEVR